MRTNKLQFKVKFFNMLWLVIVFNLGFVLCDSGGLQAQSIRPNTNINASELHYHLSTKKDTLFIRSDFFIKTITILNENFRKFYLVNKNAKAVVIGTFPKGKHTIITITNNKVITFNLMK
ncbi:hypothetical protein ES692_06090 [Psychroserpens burtonensis]|uniref:Uncharacterized protein n=1 Tax=Psychroserpens burtonensis TaxID=49278 RepID=A0A5C7BAM6_9FLAO|nr:hypothetical protein [Psychroserpens burtonensis]TXE18611.1 hypothetical protein ES692_06090 [Psychroserpens burtonensis]